MKLSACAFERLHSEFLYFCHVLLVHSVFTYGIQKGDRIEAAEAGSEVDMFRYSPPDILIPSEPSDLTEWVIAPIHLSDGAKALGLPAVYGEEDHWAPEEGNTSEEERAEALARYFVKREPDDDYDLVDDSIGDEYSLELTSDDEEYSVYADDECMDMDADGFAALSK